MSESDGEEKRRRRRTANALEGSEASELYVQVDREDRLAPISNRDRP